MMKIDKFSTPTVNNSGSKENNRQKLHSKSGIAWIFVILLVLIGIMVILIAIPVYQYYRNRADEIGCASALNTANHQLSIEYLQDGVFTAQKAKAVVTRAMDGWDDLCPGEGTPYIIENEQDAVPWRVVCGKHDEDTKERTRLNASNALEQIEKKVRSAQIQGEQYPERIVVAMNGEEYKAVLTDEDSGLKRGTDATSGVKGTVIYYSIAGHSEFGENSGVADGRVWYFSYADEEHCANWSSPDGWSGDSYIR
ncbi:MAG: hypothetical protein ACI4F1_01360 [Bariatricus sp.]